MDTNLKILKKHQAFLIDLLEVKARQYIFSYHKYHSNEFRKKAEKTQEVLSALKSLLNET
jgi:hypothetical protein